ncbi:hypothetical protein GGE65_008132 [Skermanella aerolata]|uniref:nucleoside hydrolase-like domain-containing protein n=1 Tax=Skermanella aerolata TaxID=393310 RepID=UPI003D1B0AE9
MALPRVFISTDLKLTSEEKDDAQSLIHALMYQDKMNIVGISGTASRWGHQNGREVDIDTVIDVYGKDLEKLREHSSAFKSVDELKAVSHQGATVIAPNQGYATATASSEAIIAEAKKAAAAGEKLNVLTWGGETDIAQALYDAPGIAPHVRLFTIDDQDPNAKEFIESNFKGKLDMWVDNMSAFRGVYGSPNSDDIIKGWYETNAKDHGALGDFFAKLSGDIFNESGVKMGDSPTVFRFLSGNQNDPTQESWGGEFREVSDRYYTDHTNQAFKWGSTDGALTIYEDRDAWLGSFANRFDWLKDTGNKPTEPVASGNGSDTITVKVSGDHYQGDPNFVIKVDDKVIDYTNPVKAAHDDREWETFTFKGQFDADSIQKHKIEIQFNNDNWSGISGTEGFDRNLYVDEVTFNGKVNGSDAIFKTNATQAWLFEL